MSNNKYDNDGHMRMITRNILQEFDALSKLMPQTPEMIKSMANVVSAMGHFCRDMATLRMNEEKK